MDEPDGSQEPLIKKESHTRKIDLTNRDPKQINEDVVKVDFEDVIAEPDGIHSVHVLWKSSYYTFTYTKLWFYRILTLIFGIILSLLWGLLFAFMSFLSIWAVGPCMKCCKVQFQCLWRPLLLGVGTLFRPIVWAAVKISISLKGVLRKDT